LFPEFPNFFGNLHYFLKGKTLALFRKAIYEQMPIAGNGITLQETEDGIIVSSKQGRATATASVIDFTGVLSGENVIIQGGKVLGVSWSTYDVNNPSSGGWTESVATVAGATLAVADGFSIWLQIGITPSTGQVVGALSAADQETLTVVGGTGGGGGGGGGGGCGGKTTGGEGANGVAGGNGSSGSPGTGGAGGLGGTNSPPSEPKNAGDGGQGGYGESGEEGLLVQFQNYTKAAANIRKWTVSSASFVVSASKPSSSATTANLRLLTRSGSTITHHQVGSVFISLPTVTFI
jgi:hypothetical protein